MDYFHPPVSSFCFHTASKIIKRVKDLDYRGAVDIQNKRVSPVVEWYDNKLEVGPFSPYSDKSDSKSCRELLNGINSAQKISRHSFLGSVAVKGNSKS
jgi:hypothetical protein